MRIISNAGPLIAMARINELRLFPKLFGRVMIPEAVSKEIMQSGRTGAMQMARADWLCTESVRNLVAVPLLQDDLDEGESEAIVLAIEHEADLLLIDEAKGRKVANARGLPVAGTLGILVRAKKRGVIDDVSSRLEMLLESGFRMSESLYEQILRLAGEN